MSFHSSQLWLSNFLSSGKLSCLYLIRYRKKLAFLILKGSTRHLHRICHKTFVEMAWLLPMISCLSVKGIYLLVNCQVTFSASLWKQNCSPSQWIWLVPCCGWCHVSGQKIWKPLPASTSPRILFPLPQEWLDLISITSSVFIRRWSRPKVWTRLTVRHSWHIHEEERSLYCR